MADQSGQGESSKLVRKMRKKKNESSADILAGLAKRLDENSSKKSKKKATVLQFRRDPVTGQRVCKTKYRPNRKYRASKYFDFALLSWCTALQWNYHCSFFVQKPLISCCVLFGPL